MADEILSIDTETLDGIANAIRDKGGLPQSNKLSFPDGMVSALQAIETEATVTPKITPQQVTLTKDSTSFPIAAGFHNGNGTVGITLQSKTVTPNSSQQTVEPDTGKLLSQVIVNAASSGYKMAIGSITLSDQTQFSITGLNFTPSIACLVLSSWLTDSKTPYWIISHYNSSGEPISDTTRANYKQGSSSNSNNIVSPSVQSIQYSSNSVTFYKAGGQYSSYRYHGTYLYAIWGN